MHHLRVPTEKQYSYIEFEFEGTADEAVVEYQRLTDLVNAEGLPDKEWREFLNVYLGTGSPPEDGLGQWEKMSMQQKWCVNEVKKTLKRLKGDLTS